MKKLFITLSIMMSLLASAQPNKWKYDSSRLENNIHWNYYSNNSGQVLKSYGGQVVFPQQQPGDGIKLDSNRNVVIGITPHIGQKSLNNKIFADNVTLDSSSDNTITAKNAELYKTDGSHVSGADHHLFDCQYCDVGNDANTAKGESIFIRGSGNYSSNYAGMIIGRNNYQGGFSYDEVLANRNRYLDGALIGVGLKSRGHFITMVGYGFNSERTGFHVGFGSNQFSVLPGGIIEINGVKIKLTGTPTVGSVITCTSFDGDVANATWSLPSSTKYQSPVTSQVQQAFAIYNTTGQYLGTQILILKPINKTQ